jgi:hypothetical protein
MASKKRVSLTTPRGRLSYVNLATPKENKNGAKRFKTAFVFEPGADLRELKTGIIDVATAEWGEDAAGMIRQGKLHWPIRGADEPGTDTAEDITGRGYPAGSVFMNTSSKSRPGIVDAQAVPVTDIEEEAYSGRDAFMHVTLAPFDVDGNRGVAVYVNAVQLLGHNERFDGRVSATELFSPVEGEIEDPSEELATAGASDDSIEDLVGS